MAQASEKSWQHRQQFPALANKAYFNFGGQGPLPQSALERIQNSYRYIQHHGPFSGKVNAWLLEEAHHTRSLIAQELAVPVETITLTENVTMGCNIALWGINWRQGDRILLTDCEHPGIVAITQEIGRRFGVEVATCPLLATLDHDYPVEVIREHLTPRTRLVVLSHILWNTGQVLPLAEIVQVCHDYETDSQPIQILVDAAQSVGVLPLRLTELAVDFYAFTGHKWWCGPEGLGGLYVRPQALNNLNPTFIGWRSVISAAKDPSMPWRSGGQRFEVATSAYPLYAGLREAIALHQEWGTVEERYQQICQLSEYLWQRLSEYDSIDCLLKSPPQAGLVSFRSTRHPSSYQLVKSLEEQALMVRLINYPDCVRACVHYFTEYSEIDQLVEAIARG